MRHSSVWLRLYRIQLDSWEHMLQLCHPHTKMSDRSNISAHRTSSLDRHMFLSSSPKYKYHCMFGFCRYLGIYWLFGRSDSISLVLSKHLQNIHCLLTKQGKYQYRLSSHRKRMRVKGRQYRIILLCYFHNSFGKHCRCLYIDE